MNVVKGLCECEALMSAHKVLCNSTGCLIMRTYNQWLALAGNDDTATLMSGNTRNCIIASEEELNGLMGIFEKSPREPSFRQYPLGPSQISHPRYPLTRLI